MVRLATPFIRGIARGISPFLRRVQVEGFSMAPTYMPGEYLWAIRRFLIPRRLRVGDVVFCPDPDNPRRELLKRVGEFRWTILNYDVVLLGDNHEASRDSREFGPISCRRIKWVALPNRRPFTIHQTPPTL